MHLPPNPRVLAAAAATLLPALSPAYEPPAPGITRGVDSVSISWVGGGTLVSSDSLDSDWTDAGATSSPHVVETTGTARRFYRVAYQNLVGITTTVSGASAAPADLGVLPNSLTLGGVAVDPATFQRPSQQEISFIFSTYNLAPGDYTVEAVFDEPYGVLTGTHTIHSSVLLLIVDDWGADASPIDNFEPGALLANMPTLSTLASQGLRFTRGYSQPTCSPMRSCMLTGRQAWQTGVGDPSEAGNFSTAEITLPEIFTSMAAPHDLLSVGKWHLGGNNDAYNSRGGWPEFYGINGGAVPGGDYSNWPKNSNGTVETSTVYSTSDQVNHTKVFIENNVAMGNPWFAWVAFNAVHTPLHDPPTELAPPGGYSTQGAGESTASFQYRKMLEALDTEMGRLLKSIDPAQTNIILLGDNGTPGDVVQAPYGDGRAKGSLYNGGTNVPFVVKGPAVTLPAGSTTDELVHCIDIFSTILELAAIDESAVPGLAAQGLTSTSIVPILNGTDTETRCVVVERGGDNPGRAIILDSYPDYKLIIIGDPDNAIDDPSFEFYNIGAPDNDVNEQNPLDTSSLTGTALDAYNACIAKDLSLGGGYSDPPGPHDTLYIELPNPGSPIAVPNLTRNNGNPINVTSVTVDGNPASVVGRFDSGTILADEGDDQAARYWVKARIAPANGGPYTTAHVVFPDLPAGQGGGAREYDSIGILVNPNP